MANDRELRKATQGWTAPVVVRTYKGKKAAKALEAEARIMALRGYEPEAQTEDGGHVHVGRLLLTGGLSIFAGRAGIRSKGSSTVTFKRMSGPRVDVIVDDVGRGLLATSASKQALSQVTDIKAVDVDLPVSILEHVPEMQAESVVAHLSRFGVKAHIDSINGTTPQLDQQSLDVQLTRLAELRREGALSEEEFVAAKARLLS